MLLFKYITNKVYKMHQILQQLGYLQKSLGIFPEPLYPTVSQFIDIRNYYPKPLHLYKLKKVMYYQNITNINFRCF